MFAQPLSFYTKSQINDSLMGSKTKTKRDILMLGGPEFSFLITDAVLNTVGNHYNFSFWLNKIIPVIFFPNMYHHHFVRLAFLFMKDTYNIVNV